MTWSHIAALIRITVQGRKGILLALPPIPWYIWQWGMIEAENSHRSAPWRRLRDDRRQDDDIPF